MLKGKDLEYEMIKYGEVEALKSAACDSRGHSGHNAYSGTRAGRRTWRTSRR